MEQAILLEILVRPADQSRGRHNPRAVKRKMSNFPTRNCCAAPYQSFRYDGHIVIVVPPEPAVPHDGWSPTSGSPSQPARANRSRNVLAGPSPNTVSLRL
jgi:hypothetical protein